MSLQTRSGRRLAQHPEELGAFIGLLTSEGVCSYLEVGARYGDTFEVVMHALPVGSRGVAVDLPGGPWGLAASRHALKEVVRELNQEGYDCRIIFGNSQSPQVRHEVASHGPYDVVLIDGDHRYESVAADWRNYGSLGRIVAFHDIAGVGRLEKRSQLPVQVDRLWNELKTSHRHREIVAPKSIMGIGVIFQ
jgi:methyltransferase family protein